MKTIAIIPAFNEEKTLKKILKKIKSYVNEIILIDDNSTDNTSIIAKEYATVIRHERNKGYDESINDGFKLAKKKKADIIITLDADGQHYPEDITKIIKPIEMGKADIVTGIRPYHARFMERIFANFGKEKSISDPLCGMKAYHIKVYENIGFFDNISSIGTQLIFEAQDRGYRIKGLSIRLKKRRDESRFGRGMKANYKLLRALIRLKKYLNVLKN